MLYRDHQLEASPYGTCRRRGGTHNGARGFAHLTLFHPVHCCSTTFCTLHVVNINTLCAAYIVPLNIFVRTSFDTGYFAQCKGYIVRLYIFCAGTFCAGCIDPLSTYYVHCILHNLHSMYRLFPLRLHC